MKKLAGCSMRLRPLQGTRLNFAGSHLHASLCRRPGQALKIHAEPALQLILPVSPPSCGLPEVAANRLDARRQPGAAVREGRGRARCREQRRA